MAAHVISGNISDSGVTPSIIQNRQVIARLRPVPGFRTGDDSLVFPTEKTKTDAAGDWSLTLESNNDIQPAGTYWEVEFVLGLEGSTWDISVADANAGFLASIISVLPTLETSTFLTQSAGDSRYILAENASSGLTVASASRTADFSLTGGAWTMVPHNVTDQEDVAGMHDPSTNNERLVVPAGMNRAKARFFTLLATDLSSGHNFQSKIGLNEAVAEPPNPVAYTVTLNNFRTPAMAETRWLTVSPGDFFTASARCSLSRDLLYTAGGLSRSYFELECRSV